MGFCSEDSFPIKNRAGQLPDLMCRIALTHRPAPTRVCCLPSTLLLPFCCCRLPLSRCCCCRCCSPFAAVAVLCRKRFLQIEAFAQREQPPDSFSQFSSSRHDHCFFPFVSAALLNPLFYLQARTAAATEAGQDRPRQGPSRLAAAGSRDGRRR